MLFDHFEVWEEKEGGTWDRCARTCGGHFARAANKWAARDTAYKLYNITQNILMYPTFMVTLVSRPDVHE